MIPPRWVAACYAAILAGTGVVHASSAEPGTEVPFVGCPGDGQTGPQPAPTEGTVPRLVSSELALRLAYYADLSGFGVLAPRGWHSASLHGSNGGSLLITPDARAARDFLQMDREVRTLHGVELSYDHGGTSGRFAVANMIARHFPAHKDFARRVAAEWVMDPLPSGPYPTDQVRRISATEIEFTTPAGLPGQGTERSRFAVGDAPVHGLTILYPVDDMIVIELACRLPDPERALELAIVAEVRKAGADLAGSTAAH